MGAPQYTTCVAPADYSDLDLTPELIAAAVTFIAAGFSLVGLAIGLFLLMETLHKICEYTLHGKLVCLGGDQCAIGHVASFETVDDKKGFDKLDNDFSINLLLSPWDLEDFTYYDFDKNYQRVIADGMQGVLITEQSSTPVPHEAPDDTKRYDPTRVTFPNKGYISYTEKNIPGIPYDVPIFHCEIEGERLHLFCATLDGLLSLIPGANKLCRVKVFGIPIGRLVCSLLSALLAPIIIPALIAAYFAGSNDNRDFDGAGDLNPGEVVVIRGRWVYDAGHTGWNELHPVLSVQKLSNPEDVKSAANVADFPKLRDTWCGRSHEAPPPGAKPADAGLTPDQQVVLQNQLKPNNRWLLHPELDGCQPKEEEQIIK